jgi:hypothetical protein
MRLPGFTAEAALDARSQVPYARQASGQAASSRDPSTVVPASLCGSWYGCCRHGNLHCCDMFFDRCISAP